MNLEKLTLETDRLKLMPPDLKYTEDIFNEFNEQITTYTDYPPNESLEATRDVILKFQKARADGEELFFVITDRETGEFLGCCGFHDMKEEQPELGIWIKVEAQGNKYGREALEAVKKWADENHEYDYIKYPVVEENWGSRKIAEYLGGSVQDTYEKKMRTGRTYTLVEYHIPRSLQVVPGHI